MIRDLKATRRSVLVNPTDRGLWDGPLDNSDRLAEFYLARSDRFQTYLDSGSLLTGIGALGAGLSSKAGAGTVEAWGYTALAGILLVNFSGSEPMRDLYFAGHLGVGYTQGRYVVLTNRLRELEDTDLTTDPTCRAKADTVLAKVEAWNEGADKAAFLPVARAASQTCRQIVDRRRALADLRIRAEGSRDLWLSGFTNDLIDLDNRLLDSDAQLRATPSSALTSAAVGALRVVDSLVSGENTQEAINRVRINALLDDMNLTLTVIDVPAPPQAVAGIVLSSEFETRAAVGDRPRPVRGAPVLPTKDQVASVVADLRSLAHLIEEDRHALNRSVHIAEAMHDAARRSELRFDYQVTTGTAAVGLYDPAAPRSVAPAAAPATQPVAGGSGPQTDSGSSTN